jgi:molecular chaperone DnaK (HSP70)
MIGIDLGTTNCALAVAQLEGGGAAVGRPQVELFAIPQLVNPGEERAEPLLPSFLYLTGPGDFPAGTVEGPIVGTLAQKRGSENPGRLVSSAKSWLSHAGVDRTAALLPLEAPEGVAKVSPVDASARYLAHLKQAWETAHPDRSFENILITVPASFDATARELTEKAAALAGYPKSLVLLEEPQAAFYAWIERHEDWRDHVQAGDVILVVDIGGGTTDFTLIQASDTKGSLTLERVAVGDHILLGGDNIDLALARTVEQTIKSKLDRLQFQSLWQQCRIAKEQLLGSAGSQADQWPLTLLGKGSSLIGGTIKSKIRKADIEAVLLDGFLPVVEKGERPQRRRAGLAEAGLPYASDAAITRHLAAFLSDAGAQPTKVLFNGGVLKAAPVRARILELLQSWNGGKAVEALVGEDLMHAVARGAAYYGLARQGKGIRIRGGIPKTYYIGIESAMPAVPGFRPPVKALSVAPFGMEEGTSVKLPAHREFALAVGEPAEFRFFNSARRHHDAAGEMIDDVDQDLVEMSPIEVTLDGDRGEVVRVTLESVVTETGQLQIWCVAREGKRRWKLEFNVREKVK